MSDLVMKPLPLGSTSIETLRATNEIYVDKTRLIHQLASVRGKIFLSRPRRFGKSLLVSTFESLFKFGLRDFKGLAIEKLWKEDKTYDVVHLDFSGLKNFYSVKDFKVSLDRYLMDLMIRENRKSPIQTQTEGLRAFINWLTVQAENSLVLLIDEYDAPMTACLDNAELFKQVQSVMEELFSSIKLNEGCLRFFFMTGITKFSHTGIFSAFNNLTDISLDPEYGQLLGYTEDEIQKDFAPYLNRAASALNLSRDELFDQLKTAYDGFSFDERALTHVYCPWSVLSFLNRPDRGFSNYWYQSGGQPTVLTKYLNHHELANPKSYSEDKFVKIEDLNTSRQYDEIDLNVLLTQAGYLTIKSVDPDGYVTLGYPNQEVSMSMARLYADKLLEGKRLYRPGYPWIADSLAKGCVKEVIDGFNLAVQSIDYVRYPIVSEALCRAYIQVMLIGAALIPRVEVHNAYGRCDMEVQAGDCHWAIEFKFVEKTRDAAARLKEGLEQIHSRRYAVTTREKKLIRMAVVFSAQERCFSAFETAD